MNTLLVHPAFPKTYWGMEYARQLSRRAALLPPLGLLTVAALLPDTWVARLVDVSVEPLSDADLKWADVVFVGAMQIQQTSFHEVIRRAHALGKTVVVGGAYPTTDPDASQDADSIVIGESEDLIESLCRDLESGALKARYQASQRPDVTKSPVPRFDLLRRDAYQAIGIQFSRGCPFNCEFCDIIEVFGRVPRTKTPEQLLREFEAVYQTGFHAMLFLVDDNFIGNKRAAKVMLPQLAEWMRQRDYPFDIYTEASVNLAADERLIELMVEAGFSSVFLGIETPSQESLKETQKIQNLRLDLTDAVETLTRRGLEVMAGFIVGFDADDPGCFERQRAFIQNAPIPLAMVGMLSALPGTQLWRRLEREGRLYADWSGETFGRTNFRTTMPEPVLLEGYKQLLADLYEPDAYFARCLRVLELWPAKVPSRFRFPLGYGLATLLRAVWRLGVVAPYRGAFWRFMSKALWRAPHLVARSVSQAVNGEHVIRFTRDDVVPRLALVETRAPRSLHAVPPPVPDLADEAPSHVATIGARTQTDEAVRGAARRNSVRLQSFADWSGVGWPLQQPLNRPAPASLRFAFCKTRSAGCQSHRLEDCLLPLPFQPTHALARGPQLSSSSLSCRLVPILPAWTVAPGLC